jgi:flagellar assembly protein FliH
MQKSPVVQLDKPITGAAVVTDNSGEENETLLARQSPAEKARTEKLLANLQNITETLAATESQLLRRHKEDIVNLAVEIARRIIACKVEQGDYQIQEIIKQVLDNAPVKNDIVIRLNAEDHARIEQLTKAHEIDFAKGVTFVADANISPAQCVCETPKGIIESFIDEHLDRITEALKKTG